MNLLIKARDSEVEKFYTTHDYAYTDDAGLDLFFPDDIIVPSNSTTKINLGISVELREITTNFQIKTDKNNFFVGKPIILWPRSSISKTPLRLANSLGLIDAGYRGDILAVVDNISDKDYQIKKGERLFQLVAFNGEHFNLVVTKSPLSESTRGEKGLGSSGK